MGILWLILLGILCYVIACVIMNVLYNLFPPIRWITALIIGGISFFVWDMWWLSLIVSFFSWGLFCMFTHAESKNGSKIICSKCGFDNPDIVKDTGNYVESKCPRCGHTDRISFYNN